MRPLGRTAAARATWAMAHTLFWRGRFSESYSLLNEIKHTIDDLAANTDTASQAEPLARLIPTQLSWTLALLGQTNAAREYAAAALTWTQNHADCTHDAQAYGCAYGCAYGDLGLLYCLLDEPEPCRHWSQRSDAASAVLLTYWAQSRLGQPRNEAEAQSALAHLRRRGRAQEARAFSLYAQALFHQAPAYAATQLDAAIDMNERCGLHLWEARLLHLKAQSLDAAGQLSEASRFLQLAHAMAQRQNAHLFLREMTDIDLQTESPLQLDPAS
jgi:tetratricopeptide (TPR) repeat protein